MGNMSPLTTLSPVEIALIKPVLDFGINILKPLALEAWQATKLTTDLVKFELCLGEFETYLQNSYQRHSYFTSLVFKNEQKLLDDYYLLLTLLKHSESKHCKIDKFPHDLLFKYRNIMIVDTAGMGKSTISKYLFLRCIREETHIPILIELRKLSKNKSVIDFIVENTKTIDWEVSREFILKLISTGRIMFIFDGYDEIAESERGAITTNIIDFIAMAPKNWYVMTSRDDASLIAFSNFQRFTIQPLDKFEAYKLLRLYDKDTDIAEVLIEKLEEKGNENVHEFLASPLLTSLLFKSFLFKRTIPVRKHIFYRQVFEALFETHDLMKEQYQRVKRSGMDIDQFDMLLRYLSFITYQEGKNEYTKSELLICIEKAKELTNNKSLIASNVIHDLTNGVPLMIVEGDYFRWVHKSMQEYFAAAWICQDSKAHQSKYLLKMYKNEKHQNLTILCADIEPVTFRKTVIKDIAIKLKEEYEKSYLTISESNTISQEQILIRKHFVTGHVYCITKVDPKKDHLGFMNMLEAIKFHFASNNLVQGLLHGQTFNVGKERISIFDIQIKANSTLTALPLNITIPFLITEKPKTIKAVDPLRILSKQDFLIIDDTPNNPANHKVNFELVNQLLSNSRIDTWRFDYIKAVETLQEIDAEIEEAEIFNLDENWL